MSMFVPDVPVEPLMFSARDAVAMGALILSKYEADTAKLALVAVGTDEANGNSIIKY